MSRRTLGWIWVGAQAGILIALVVLPRRSDWPTPGWLTTVAAVLFFAGLGLIAIAALGLGSALTPTPVPNQRASLRTSGLYAWVRHPIYTGVLSVVIGMVARSGSWLSLAVGIGAVVFFDRKAAWEEDQLRDAYPDYPAYAAQTPKFVPRPPAARRG